MSGMNYTTMTINRPKQRTNGSRYARTQVRTGSTADAVLGVAAEVLHIWQKYAILIYSVTIVGVLITALIIKA